jgi:hypothetical protein
VKVYQGQLQAMQSHLCQILAHFVVYLGSQLSLPIASHVEQFILEAAAARWHKEGNFEWLTTPGDELEPTVSPDIWPDLPTNGLDSFSGPYFGNPSLFNENAFQDAFDSLLPMGSLESSSGQSTGQTPHSRSPFGGVENPNAVVNNPSSISNHQRTLPVSKVALESFDHWNSKWETNYENAVSAGLLGICCNNFVTEGSWGGMLAVAVSS